MKIFDYKDEESLGQVRSVDTSTVMVQVKDVEKLRRLQVNRLAVLQSSRPGQHLIGLIQKITRTAIDGKKLAELAADDENVEGSAEINLVKISLIGTVLDKQGEKENVFTPLDNCFVVIRWACNFGVKFCTESVYLYFLLGKYDKYFGYFCLLPRCSSVPGC